MIPVVLEGDTDVPVVSRLFELVGLELGTVYGLRGKNLLDQRLPAYNNAARHSQWFALRDLNGDAPCAAGLVEALLPHRAAGMCLRIAVRATESWLLADRDRMSEFLSVPVHRIPADPEAIDNPKLYLVNLARRSRKRASREDMVPAPGTTARVGPGYSARIIEFASKIWRPEVARAASPSLARCMAALRGLER